MLTVKWTAEFSVDTFKDVVHGREFGAFAQFMPAGRDNDEV